MKYSMKVLLITGGDSSEREVSLNSAKNVEKSLIENGHEVFVYDLHLGYEPLIEMSKKFDILFPVLHGEEGEGGKLHKFLSELGKPIVGTRDYKALEKGWYKISFKEFCDKNGIKTSPWKIVKNERDIQSFGFPSVLKASNGGSSKEVAILKRSIELNGVDCQRIIKSKAPIYVEKYLPGIEVTVGVLNNKPLPVLEIIPPQGSWFNYENKYAAGTQELPFAPSVNPKLQEKIQQIALDIHKNLDLGGYSRTDFIIHEDEPYALEINTIPGLTANSLMPKAAKAAGMSFNEFIEELLKSAS